MRPITFRHPRGKAASVKEERDRDRGRFAVDAGQTRGRNLKTCAVHP